LPVIFMTNTVATTEYTFATLMPQQVYDAWLDPALVRLWMSRNMEAKFNDYEVTDIRIDPVVGGRFFLGGKQGGEPSDAWGYYRELVPGRRIVFTWFVEEGEEKEDNSTVTLELAPSGSGTRASMSHEMDVQWEQYAPQTAQAWHVMLEAIDQTIA
jgi:uncharacterized protein YndB with AHSA1/START domain